MTEKANIPEDKHGNAAPLKPENPLVAGGRNPFAPARIRQYPDHRGSTVLYRAPMISFTAAPAYTYRTRGTRRPMPWKPPDRAVRRRRHRAVPRGSRRSPIALMSCLEARDHLLVSDSVYRPTR